MYKEEKEEDEEEGLPPEFRGPKTPPPPVFHAPLTKAITLICILVYLLSMYQNISLIKAQNKKGSFSIQLTPIQKSLLYDSHLEKGETWTGFYGMMTQKETRDTAPWFSDIKNGEVWRLFTPIFLHANILHLLFNMLWFWLLGKMIEENMKPFHFLCFLSFAALITNSLQYLMTGPFFMGISGVVAAMAGYIWVRKRSAPWEYYPISKTTINILGIYIFGLVLLQIIVFFLRISHILQLDINMANTAHLSGVLIGLGLAKVKFFERRL